MSETTPMATALQNVLPDALLRSIEQSMGKDDEAGAQERYRILLRGFEQYNLQQRIPNYRIEFAQALHDLIACLRCDGNTCRTKCGNQCYYALHRRDIEFYGGRPMFRIFTCPGVAERKEQLRRLYVENREDEEPPGKGQYPW